MSKCAAGIELPKTGPCPQCKAGPNEPCPAAFARQTRYVRTLEDLVQCLIDNDPEDLAADGGIRVIDVWRKDAERALAHTRPHRGEVE